jgi:hypothetical protein
MVAEVVMLCFQQTIVIMVVRVDALDYTGAACSSKISGSGPGTLSPRSYQRHLWLTIEARGT